MDPLSSKLPWEQANPKWAAALNPLLFLRLVNGQQLSNIVLTANTPKTIYHSLGQVPQGWIVVDNVTNSYIIRTQPFTAKSVTLQASVNTTIAIWIY